ncbi:hypothetical protein HK100_006793 [Physocladia obscura]|uniref:Uncharacterized protein n=1 Tax=Physocladia obscura TaxID=109957 RepID=A0AAD5XIW3_9FUNG|nr:hypothetical protein HK100_006793 [Physocladia obscura]
MGQPLGSRNVSPNSTLNINYTGAQIVNLAAAVTLFAVLGVLCAKILAPIGFAFASAVALSVPLHYSKPALATFITSSSFIEACVRFIVGPSTTELVTAYIDAFSSTTTHFESHRSPIVTPASEPFVPVSLLLLRWALRFSVAELLWTSVEFRTFALIAGSIAVSIKLFFKPTIRPSTSTTVVLGSQKHTNLQLTAILISSLVVFPTIVTVYFTNALIHASPDILYSVVSFIANPAPSYIPDPHAIIPDFGARKLVFELGVPQIQSYLIDAIDSTLAISYPGKNISCVDGAQIALSWNNDESNQKFRAKFPQTIEAIELVKKGQKIKALIATGPAIAEIRWMGPDAFSFTISSTDSVYINSTISKQSLDPTNSIIQAITPILGDLAFFALVFFSTLWVLVDSELGVSGYASKLFGGNGAALGSALAKPLAASFKMNLHILVFRLSVIHLINLLILPASTRAFQATLPFIAGFTTFYPLIPPILALGIAPAIVLFVVFGAPFSAAAIIYVQCIWSPESNILQEFLGTDGIAVVDGFSAWLGWMAFGSPFGLIIGPWAVVAFRRVYRVLTSL